MTTITTENWGFIGVYNATPSTNDWACTYWNWIAVDSILYGLVSHTHDGATAIQNPTGTLSLSTATTGGYLPSDTTYYFAITYLDALSRETAASDVSSQATGAGISTPATPTINDDATPTDIQPCVDGLDAGEYWYKISYLKGSGETLPSLPVYVSIPANDYECTIHFISLATAANGADTIRVYRKIGTSGSYVKLADITNTATDSYTDDNTGVPSCDTNPKTASTINGTHTITIDWSALDWTDAEKIRIYATLTEGTYTTTSLVAEVDNLQSTPVSSYVWTGTARTTGKPPEISQCYPNPDKILLTDAAEVQGLLPWANIAPMGWSNLPSTFTWEEPVADYASLPTGIAGEARVVLDEDTIYIWDADAATPLWIELTGRKSTIQATPTLSAGATPPSSTNFTITGIKAGLIVRVLMTVTQSGTPDYDLEIYTDSGRTDLAYQAQNIDTATFDDRIPWEWYGTTTMYCTLLNNSAEDITASTIDIDYRI